MRKGGWREDGWRGERKEKKVVVVEKERRKERKKKGAEERKEETREMWARRGRVKNSKKVEGEGVRREEIGREEGRGEKKES